MGQEVFLKTIFTPIWEWLRDRYTTGRLGHITWSHGCDGRGGKYFVSLTDLHEKVGQRLAQLIGVEAVLVTTGAAGGRHFGYPCLCD
jgi:hypothetical protein